MGGSALYFEHLPFIHYKPKESPMRTFTMLSLACLMVFAACKRSETQPANQPQKQTTASQPVQKEDPGKLQKWPADYPVTGDSVAVIDISIGGQPAGEVVAEFYPDKAPNHVRNFKWLADHKFYNGVKFHRVIKGFMIQGGDPTGTGGGGPGWALDAEFNDIKHVPGILSMARTNDPNSAGSQFFIMHGTTPHLDGQYSVFGKVIKGLEVVNKIAALPVGGPQNSSPMQEVVMTSVKIVPRSAVK
jgi:peptidyl-prolyl cis-trans isomerase B (cyclophilin B)